MVFSKVACPKRTLQSGKWQRNDSSSVGKLLQPFSSTSDINDSTISSSTSFNTDDGSRSEDDEEEPRRFIYSDTCGGIKRIHMRTHCPDCYCKSFSIAPAFGKKKPINSLCCCKKSKNLPDHCVKKEKSVQGNWLGREKAIQSCCHKKEKGVQNYCVRRETGVQGDLQFTSRRRDYETQTKDYFIDLQRRIHELEEQLRAQEQQRLLDQERLEDEKLRQEDQEQQTPGRNELVDIMQFRNSQYFACHSAGSGTTLPNRPRTCAEGCVHKFALTNNLQLEPDNADEYGTSRCTACRRALHSKTSLVRHFMHHNTYREDYDYINRNNKCRCSHCMKKPVTVEVRFPRTSYDPTMSKQSDKASSILKTLPPTNSMALRFQKTDSTSFPNSPRPFYK